MGGDDAAQARNACQVTEPALGQDTRNLSIALSFVARGRMAARILALSTWQLGMALAI